MLIQRRILGIISLGFIFTIFAATASLIHAQETQERVSLSISPQVIEVSANPGDSVENQVRLDNLSAGSVEIEVIKKNFTPRGEEGAVDLTEDDTTYSLADWITVSPEKLVMEGNSSQDFKVTINIPSNAEPGGHFGSVVFKTIPPVNEEGAASVSQEIAPVILTKVAGDIVESANIADFSSTKSFWTNEDVISLETRIENTGNVHFKPTGTITIKNMFGQEVTTLDLEEKNVLPDSIRKLTNDWQDPGFAIGKYTADLTLVFGENNEILSASTSFIVFPWQTVVPAVIIFLALVFIIVKGRSRIAEAFKVLSGRD